MLKFTFDPSKCYRAVIYARMSSDRQNKRSPDQQIAEVKKRLKTQGYPWTVIKVFRDDGISGRLLRKRRGLQQMLQDIYSGVLVVDLILVDTIERFGRVEELPSIRKELYDKYGILLLSGDTNFCDPTSPQGKAMGMVEAMRATEDTRIKAHNVLRGKRDIALRKYWPGGKAPFGLQLHSVTSAMDGKVEIDGSILKPCPETGWIIALLFTKSHQTGWGETRLSRFLNAHPDIPEKHKPFYPATVGYWLKQPIYKGVLVWAEHCTGIIDDTRVIRSNPEEEILTIPDFCEPLISTEVWDAVNALRKMRADRTAAARQQKEGTNGKQLTAPAPGMTLKYLLTGLVRCGHSHCGRAMTPSSSPIYTTTEGVERRYVSYVCPGYLARVCINDKRVPEDWLRKVVVDTIRARLFPPSSEGKEFPMEVKDLEAAPWFPDLVDQVRHELARLASDREDPRPGWEKERQSLEAKVTGLSQSLCKPDLNSSVRAALEQEFEGALAIKNEIDARFIEYTNRQRNVADLLDPAQVVQQLNRLEAALAANNPTLGNLELSLHIDRINCYADGKVVIRSCRLGALAPAIDLLSDDHEEEHVDGGKAIDGNGAKRVKPKRRARLRTDPLAPDAAAQKAAAHIAADPDRFAGLGEEWFWEDLFNIPEKTYWAKEHAAEVARMRATGLTHEQLAKRFGKTMPTIRSALLLANSADADAPRLPRKMPRRRWTVDHATEVAQLKKQGMGTNDLAQHFQKSDTTIREALRIAEFKATEGDSAPVEC